MEDICAEARELLHQSDVAVLAHIFSPAYHKTWIKKVREQAIAEAMGEGSTPHKAESEDAAEAFEPACLVEVIEQLPYMQAFKTAYARMCAQEVSSKNEGENKASSDDEEQETAWSETEAYYRLQAMFYAQTPSLPSAFLKSYYRFDWEWKAVNNRLNRKLYAKMPMDDRVPAYPYKGEKAEQDEAWIQALDKEPLAQLWDYADIMEKTTAEADPMKREWLGDSFRWQLSEAWGGDATAESDYIWAYFIRLQLQQRWQRLKKADGREMLKEKLQSLRTVDWDKNEFSATLGA